MAVRVLAAPDKFRGTATADDVAGAIAAAVEGRGGRTRRVPLSDGGEGFLDVFGGANRTALVTGPSGQPVEAGWRLDGRRAVIEMARASGLVLAGGAAENDALAATTAGTGELIGAALDAGARKVIIGHGGSATTDGGLGAVKALSPVARLRGVELVAAVDVRTAFTRAAVEFGAQKGASAHQVDLLTRRLERLVQLYRSDFGVEVDVVPGAGAAGGLAGGLMALGAEIVSGFDLIAEELDLLGAMERVDLVVTGEGFVDGASFDGKVVGGVVNLASEVGVPVLVVAGEVFDEIPAGVDAVSLVERFGRERSMADPLGCVREVVDDHLRLLAQR
ncbi:MAG: glycerate kinase [Microthrixaceae bacterium]|nr:glycerate kinase [Acidimicrobiales bacterium]MCB9403012.1 glycerate kinase [Microthrixaceae bacterium]